VTELTEQQVLREEVLSAIDAILKRWQVDTKSKLTAEQITSVYSLFTAWGQGISPQNHLQYGLQIGPILCNNAQQQTQFQQFWQAYWKIESTDTVSSHKNQSTPAPQASTNTDTSKKKQSIRALKRRKRIAIGILVFAIVSLLAYIAQEMQPEKPEPVIVAVSTTGMEGGGDIIVDPTPPPEQQNKPYLKQIPQRQPAPSPTFSALHQQQLDKMKKNIIGSLLALAMLISSLIWWWRRIRFDSQSSAATANQQIDYKVAVEDIDKELIPDFRNTLAKLRFDRLGGKVVNWPKTLKTTAAQAGFTQLHYRQRKRQLDYLIISDNRHLRDQSAWLMQRLSDMLVKANIHVRYYDFDRYPEWLRPKGQHNGKPLSLAQLLATHSESRLILAVNHELLFYRISGETQQWLEDLQGHQDYQLLLLSAPTTVQAKQLTQQGYAFRILNQQTDLGALLSQQDQKNTNAKQGVMVFDDNWLDDIEPNSSADAIAWIKQSVGAEGLRLLGILSLYPKLQGDLSFALLQWFRRKDCTQTLQTQTFMQVITLPWCRQGWLPQWLRDVLLKQLSAYDYQHATRFYQQLFEAEQRAGVKTLQLEVQKTTFWEHLQWMRSLFSEAGIDSPLRDQIFAKILLAPRRNITRLLLPHRLLQALPRAAVSLWIPMLVLVLAIGGLMTACYTGWQHWGANWYGKELLQEKQQQYAEATVLIRYHPDAKALVDLLGAGLDATGFKVAKQQDKSIKSNSISAPGTFATELNNIAQYISWGSVFSVSTDTENSVITIATPPQTGQVFRDHKPHPVQLQTDYKAKEALTWQKIKPDDTKITPPVVTYNPKIKPILPKMIAIPAGEFVMGSPDNEKYRFSDEEPLRQVTLKAFSLAETELTFAEWDQCVKAEACREVEDEGWGRAKRPVINVSWDDAQTYIRWLNQTQVLSSANAYRLPTEAEWEYAARATTVSAYYWKGANQCEYANGADLALKEAISGLEYAGCDDGYAYTATVGTFKPNLWGLYDMSGNVSEWTQDCWHEDYKGAPVDGRAWLEADNGDCTMRSVRGGGWNSFTPRNLRSANRDRLLANGANNDMGFRLARTL